MLVDYHTHHYRCGHAEGNLIDYVESALRAGLSEIGLSDHSPIYHLGEDPHILPGTAMSHHEFPSYVREMHEVRERFRGRIAVRLGVESDYVMGWDEHYRKLWHSTSLDYVIGSVHWLGTWNIFSSELPAGRSAEDIYEEYLRTTQAAARSGVYDIIGHLDCLKTRGHIPDLSITPLLEETVRAIAQSGVAIELNTSGWRKGLGEPYPREELLAVCRHYGVPVTLGSDAHRPEDVAAGFPQAVALLERVGYASLVRFENRKKYAVPLK
ncbi:histidinol-phosphatase HisJ family protein [Deinococcus sp. KSM4-11]|uniref:histidinol-phosphatase HisJ family protein n=1 Tax=Deinococcus sp. KSM4-11 TaxID=2568654 RepID=UPI0010A3BC11|nr:histidinol-phosphatase HisJ family protein [Deinococcus sp. KSM4-11]THF85477.1 histidinol-phosphatase HisJ family protein [Deinococcus sp. KSM4-11]